jgi:PAS domain S-box-containing protein
MVMQVNDMLFLSAALAGAAAAAYAAHRRFRRVVRERAARNAGERRYRLIAEQAGDLVALVDRDGRWLYTSPSHARLFRAEDLAIGGDAFRNVHEDDQFRLRGALQVVVRSGESCRLRLRLHTQDAGVLRFEALVHAAKDEGGQIVGAESRITGAESRITGAVMVARDVTGQRDREEQMEVAAQAFERLSEAMMITNAAGRILMVNQSYSRITGYPADDVVGRPENEFRSAMQPESFYDEIYAAVLRSGHWDGTSWCRRRDGTLYHEWRSVSAVRDAEEKTTHFVTLFRELDARGADIKSA